MKKPSILIAEEDMLVATDLAFELEIRGMAISGMAHSLKETLKAIEKQKPDLALLNLGFQDGRSYPAARRLRALGVPFAFLTAFEEDEIDLEFRDIPRLSKPQESGVLAASAIRIAKGAQIGKDSRQISDLNATRIEGPLVVRPAAGNR